MDEIVDKALLNSLVDLESLYEDAPCGYFSFTPTGLIIKANGTLLNWLGYDKEQVTYKMYFNDMISRGGKIYYEMFYFPLLQLQNAVNEISFDFIRKNRSRFPALVNSSVIRSATGEVLVVNATVYDITDRKKYEHELLIAKQAADSERSRFEFLSDFIPEMLWTADPNGIPNYVNKRLSTFFGLSNGQILTHILVNKVDLRDRFSLLTNWVRAVKIGIDFQAQVRLIDEKNGPQWYLIRAVAFKSEAGQVLKWMGSCTNINEHVTAIEKLDEFISVASHELKTPITTLKASLQLMDRIKHSDKELKVLPKLIDQSTRSIEKINTLVTDLLNAGNIKEGQMQLDKSLFDIENLLNMTCQHVRDAGAYRISIECESGLQIFADEHRIDQVLVNFVNNAIKYAPDSMEIFISAKAVVEGIRLEVRDTGPGIAPEKIKQVFERYYRVEKTGHSYTGLGLGLYICAEIIARHGGKIGVESEVGKGSTFWLTLPAFM
jgi:PAS domain S-box-containing protein